MSKAAHNSNYPQRITETSQMGTWRKMSRADLNSSKTRTENYSDITENMNFPDGNVEKMSKNEQSNSYQQQKYIKIHRDITKTTSFLDGKKMSKADHNNS